MKSPVIPLLLAGLIAAGASAAPERTAGRLAVDGYAAVINKRVITVGEVMAMIEPLRDRLKAAYEGKELEEKLHESWQRALDALIERALVMEEYEQEAQKLPERVLDSELASTVTEQFGNDRAAFFEALAESRMTMEEWRQRAKESIVFAVLRRREVIEHVVVPPRLVREQYEARLEQYRLPEQVKLRMIALQRGETEQDRTVKLDEARQIRSRLIAGEDFAQIARSASEGAKADQGGDL